MSKAMEAAALAIAQLRNGSWKNKLVFLDGIKPKRLAKDAITAWLAAEDEGRVERLAALEHEQWAHWTDYMLANSSPENVKRWVLQCAKPYDELSETEKRSDRDWALKVIKVLQRE